MNKICVFDLDGTLTDTLESLTVSVNETLEEMKLSKVTNQQCRAFVGNGARFLMQEVLKISGDPNVDRIEEAMQIYGRIFDKYCTYHVVPYEGITKMLSDLKEQGFQLAVLTNKPHKQAVHVVEEVFGKGVFELIQGQKDGIPRKPDPTAVLEMIRQVGSTTEQAVFIGDSEVDIATGLAANVKTIGVTWGFRSREILVASGAKQIAKRPEEIITLIKE